MIRNVMYTKHKCINAVEGLLSNITSPHLHTSFIMVFTQCSSSTLKITRKTLGCLCMLVALPGIIAWDLRDMTILLFMALGDIWIGCWEVQNEQSSSGIHWEHKGVLPDRYNGDSHQKRTQCLESHLTNKTKVQVFGKWRNWRFFTIKALICMEL